jgi:ABC-type phosphate transport system substrate-binding protein
MGYRFLNAYNLKITGMKNTYCPLWLSLTLLLGTTLFGFTPAPAPAEFAVIINGGNPVSSLTASEVKLYYLRKLKKRWPGINKNIRPVDRKTPAPEQEAFYSRVLDMSAVDVEKYFTNKQLQSAERPPDRFSVDADIISFVATEPGAIGYVNLKSLTPDAREKVKIVLQF